MNVEKLIRTIIKEAFIDANGELGGFSLNVNSEFRELKRMYPKLETDIAVYETGREKIMDLFDILDITQKQYVAYLDDSNRTKRDGSIDASRAGVHHKVYNFIE